MQGGIWLETAEESFCFVLWAYGIVWISELCFLSSCSTWGVFNRFYGTELYFLAECKYSRVSMTGKKASPSLWGKCNWPTSCIVLLSPQLQTEYVSEGQTYGQKNDCSGEGCHPSATNRQQKHLPYLFHPKFTHNVYVVIKIVITI